MQDLDLAPKPSRLFLLLLGLLLTVTTVTIYLIDISPWLKVLLWLPATGLVLQSGRGETCCFRRIVTNGREWTVTLCEETFSATLLGDSTVTSSVMILRWGIQHQRRKLSLVLFRDTLDRESWRRLSVVARLGA